MSTSRDASSSTAFRASRSLRASASRVPGADSGGTVAGARSPTRKTTDAPNEASVTMPASATNKAPRRGAAA
jgi:hypothetical protein